MNRCRVLDNRTAAMIHLVNILSVTFLIYAYVTRGARGVARVLERVTRK